jgi:hypothetical protein
MKARELIQLCELSSKDHDYLNHVLLNLKSKIYDTENWLKKLQDTERTTKDPDTKENVKERIQKNQQKLADMKSKLTTYQKVAKEKGVIH